MLVYFFIDTKYKNAVILIGSIFFYAWGAPKFIFVILFTTFLDFYLVGWMDRITNERQRKLMLVLSISINLGLLVYFKYSNFFIENVNAVLSVFGDKQIHWTKLILPIGISFYTFETITYVVDVYRRVHKPLTKFWDYQLYIILFPKLIAGPIIRYHELADQISERVDLIDDKLTGFYRFVFGLAKKVLIANQMGLVADEIFGTNYNDLDTITAWVGSLAYTFQIYFDFSGYSDMAIGLAKMMGFKFPENFNNPYISQSITDFWRRWHMTLGSWMKNYLYIPLGGNKVSKGRLYFNLWLVFLASGLWHGASWSFIFWGAFHGFFLVIERAFLGKILIAIGKIPAILITFFIVNIGWVFFRVDKISDAFNYLKKMFTLNFKSEIKFDNEFITYFIIAIFFSFFAITNYTKKIQDNIYFNSYSNLRHLTIVAISLVLFVLSVSSITSSGFNPFIYFRF
ncbi:MAG: MBOAT family O-acyltransferase [Bacteroidota bacterium]|nr:MBOAT family O-acyltransferase [Bacteroidota bacterium]MDP3145033.1 MBOAT family O-acyltransferase [Bacteroidota bacterium]